MAKKSRFYTPKTKRDLADYDYLDQLSDAEKEWLQKFNDEYYRGSISDEPLHTPKQKRELFNKNNRENRDAMAHAINFDDLPPDFDIESQNPNPEEILIAKQEAEIALSKKMKTKTKKGKK